MRGVHAGAVTARSPSALPDPQVVLSDATRSTPLAHGTWLGFVDGDPLDFQYRSGDGGQV